MIKFDYLIRRDEGDEVRTYTPSLIPKELSDLVYIQGPNSSGKSTLLNIIALGFFGDKLKEDELNPALREKIIELKNSHSQEVTFNIEIDNKVIGKKLKAIKNHPTSKDIKVIEISGETESIIGYDAFFSEYKLIYDIPTDPTGRFKELLREIKNNQEVYESYVIDLRKRIDFYIDEIRSGRNPEKLEELNNTKRELLEEKEILVQEIVNLESNYRDLKILYLQKFLLDYIDQCKSLVNSKNEIKRVQKLTAAQKKDIKNYNDSLYSTKILLPQVINLLNLIIKDESKKRIQLLQINIDDFDITILKEVNKELKFFDRLLEEIKNNTAINEIKFLNQLKDFLFSYMDENLNVPATGKSVKDFLFVIDEEIKKKGSAIQLYSNITLCQGKISELYPKLNNLFHQRKKLKSIPNYSEHNNTNTESNNENLNNQIISLQEKIKNYKNELLALNVEVKNITSLFDGLTFNQDEKFLYGNLNETQFNQTFDNLESEINHKREMFNKSERKLQLVTEDISNIENKEPHKYHSYLNELEGLRKEIFILEALFNNNFDENIKLLMNPKKLGPLKLNQEQASYAENVSQFLASKIRYIKHVDKNHEIAKIDIINERIITTNGKIIQWGHLGTGQGQGAYLEGLININDNRKIIALFDEVAMMDSDTLKPIFQRLLNLYKEKKLLMAIIVQKQDFKLTINDLIKQ